MTSLPRSVLFTRSLYAATAVLVVAGLALQLVPSTRRLEASSTNASSSVASREKSGAGATESLTARELADTLPGDTTVGLPGSVAFDSAPSGASAGNPNSVARAVVPGEFQAVVVSNIFSPERAPPRARYRPRGSEEAPPTPERKTQPRVRLFGVTLRATGAVALIDADPRVPGAEIYRVGDSIAGGRLVEIGPASVVIERSSGRQVIRLETEPPARRRSPGAAGDSVRAPGDSVRRPGDSVRIQQ
jgi:hypothetical protein